MILYLAGGFHFSNKVENEKKLGEHLLNKYGRYNRLATFYYKKDADNIILSVEELSENKRTSGHNTKGNPRSRLKKRSRPDKSSDI